MGNPILIPAARRINDGMPHHVVELADDALREMGVAKSDSVVTVLGGSFLRNSGDTRNSPTITLMTCLRDVGDLRIHDPHVDELEGVRIENNIEKALRGSDLAILMVDHDEYSKLTPSFLKKLMRRPAIVDGRNVFSQEEVLKAGFVYRGIGKKMLRSH